LETTVDANFVELDVLLMRIREPETKKYFSDAIRSYKSGALRPAISAAWVAIVYDFIAKYRELAGAGDNAARAFITEWDTATQNSAVEKLLKLEGSILDHATAKTQIINAVTKRQLERIREDRHLCAHPAFSTEAQLFEPIPELARLHLVSAIDLVLSQEPLQGKAILEQFSVDVQSIGFPSEQGKAFDYIEQRYLSRIRRQNLANFGAVLAKSLLKGVPEQWKPHSKKVALSLAALRDRSGAAWLDIRAAIVRLIDAIEPANRLNAVAFLVEFPDFWNDLQNPTKLVLVETLRNTDVDDLDNLHVLTAVRLPQFQDAIQRIIAELSEEQVRAALLIEPMSQLWPRAILIYARSGGFRASERNFRTLVDPFAGQLASEQFGELLNAIIGNGQNWDAGGTPGLLESFLEKTLRDNYPPREIRDEFVRTLSGFARLDDFDGALELLRRDGWVPPAVPAADAEHDF
jgi:hypothetical protein